MKGSHMRLSHTRFLSIPIPIGTARCGPRFRIRIDLLIHGKPKICCTLHVTILHSCRAGRARRWLLRAVLPPDGSLAQQPPVVPLDTIPRACASRSPSGPFSLPCCAGRKLRLRDCDCLGQPCGTRVSGTACVGGQSHQALEVGNEVLGYFLNSRLSISRRRSSNFGEL